MKKVKFAATTMAYIVKVVLFLCSVVLILYLMPKEGKFKYTYEKGKPWQYNLLIAPFDFPIFKSAKELKIERDSMLSGFKPYYIVDTLETEKVIGAVTAAFNKAWAPSGNINPTRKPYYLNALLEQVAIVCHQGIMSFEDHNNLKSSNVQEIVVVESQVARTQPINLVLTPRAAYERILVGLNSYASLPGITNMAQNLDLNNYLNPNLNIDKNLSEKLRDDLLHNISATSGMVQRGERIITLGEIVNDNSFKVLESFRKEYERQVGSFGKKNFVSIGHAVLVSAMLLSLLLFLFFYRREVFDNQKHFIFILLNVVGFVLLSIVMVRFTTWRLYFLPFAILPITMRTFFDSRIAIFANIITILIVSLMARNSYEFVLLEIMSGMAATFSLKDLNSRGQLVRTSFVVFLTYCFIYFGLSLVQEGDINSLEYRYFAYFGINGILLLFAYPLIFIYEKTFGYLSNVTLIELANNNHPLLRRLSENAPGTFQHSHQVANLAQEAAFRINANPLLAYTGALYHDIGKSVRPIYFTENQRNNLSPHKNMDERESSKLVVNHVEEGVRLALKYNLPEMIIDFIRTHHGNGMTQYFYITYKNKHPEEAINPKDFSYPGPTPFTKELAILMMADSVEAASRSLKEYTDESISELIERIVGKQVAEGQFKYAPITFADIETVKSCFKEKLMNIYHTRIEYPKESVQNQPAN